MNMKKMKKLIIGWILIAVTTTHIFGASVVSEFSIITNTNAQKFPAIYGDIVVFEDNRNGNWDLYGYNLSTSTEFPICTNAGDQMRPKIYGSIVVWYDTRNGNWDIYGYNLSTSTEFPVCTNPHDQYDPAIYENLVVWADYRNGNRDIYGYNLSTSTEFPVRTIPNDQLDPALYGDILIYEDHRNGNPDIYGYNLSTSTEFPICTNTSPQYDPAIYGNTVVWLDWRSGRDIYGYNLSTSTEFPVCAIGNSQNDPAIHQDIVVWQDDRSGSYDIYGYDLSTSTEFPVCTAIGGQYNTAIYDNVVVWEDNRNGNLDIYGATLDTTIDDCIGPITSIVSVKLKPPKCPTSLKLKAVIDDSTTGNSNIQAAEYFIDTITGDGTGTPIAAQDGSFDSVTETVKTVIDVTGLSGLHKIYVHGQDAQGNWGVFYSASFTIACSSDIQYTMNKQIRPLAQYNILKAEELSIAAQDLLSQAQAQGFDTLECEELLENAENFLATAHHYFEEGHYIAANIYALKAIEVYEEAVELLKTLFD
jgi:beta propeller repeat protein